MVRFLAITSAIGVGLALLLAACDKPAAREATTPAATAPELTAAATAPALAGNALVYYKVVRWGSAEEGRPSIIGVFTVSPGGQPVERFRVAYEAGWTEPYVLVPGRTAVLVPQDHSLVLYDLASGVSTTIWRGPESTYILRAAVSPDGSRVAFSATASSSGLEGELSIVTLNIDGSDARTIISAPEPLLPGFRGVPMPVAWWPDNSTIVYQGMIPAGTFTSTGVSGADGSDFHAPGEPLFWRLSPDGRFAVRPDQGPGEGCLEPARALLLLDLATETERELRRVEIPVVFTYEWSPDGAALLYGWAQVIGSQRPVDPCRFYPDESTWQWHLLDMSTDEERPVPSVAEAHRLWTGLAYDEGPDYVLRIDGVDVSVGEYVRVLGVADMP